MDNVNLEDAYYRAIAFVVIFFAVKILLQIIGSMLDFVAQIPVLKQLNIWAGGLLGFLKYILLSFIFLFIAALLPIEAIQSDLNRFYFSRINDQAYTRFFHQLIQDLWII